MSGRLFTHLCNLLGTSKCISSGPLPGKAYKAASVWRGWGWLLASLSLSEWEARVEARDEKRESWGPARTEPDKEGLRYKD